MLGYRADDLVGVRVRDLVEPVDRDAWQALVARLFDDPATPARGTFRCRHKDGSVRWTEGVARNLLQEPRVGGIVVYYRDVTARKATEQQLKATEDRYGHLFSSAADIIFEADAEGYFRFVNPQTLKVFEFDAGRSDRPPLHRVHSRRLPPADPSALLQADAASGRPNSYVEFPAVTKSGQRSVARAERVDHDRRDRASWSACRRWRATSPSGAAPKKRCAPPRRSIAPSSNSR